MELMLLWTEPALWQPRPSTFMVPRLLWRIGGAWGLTFVLFRITSLGGRAGVTRPQVLLRSRCAGFRLSSYNETLPRYPRGVSQAAWLATIEGIGAFLIRWGAQASAQGWTAVDLFGADAAKPENYGDSLLNRLDRTSEQFVSCKELKLENCHRLRYVAFEQRRLVN
jgi:hypothetical protein